MQAGYHQEKKKGEQLFWNALEVHSGQLSFSVNLSQMQSRTIISKKSTYKESKLNLDGIHDYFSQVFIGKHFLEHKVTYFFTTDLLTSFLYQSKWIF